MKTGLLPISQEAAIVGDISYYDYKGLLVDPEEREAIAGSLGIRNKVRRLNLKDVVTFDLSCIPCPSFPPGVDPS